MFDVENIPGCHSCQHEKQFNTEREPCKSCFGLSHYKEAYMSKWSDIRSDYYDDIEEVQTVDAWVTDSDDEEGKVIAKIHYNRSCYFK